MARQRLSRLRRPVTCFAVAVGLAVLVVGCGGSRQVGAKSADSYTGPSGWSLRYPAGTFLERSSRGGLGALWEITFASFAQRSATSGERIDLGPPRDAAGVFPTTGVALRITDFRALAFVGGLADSAFPVRLSDFGRIPSGAAHRSGPTESDDTLIADGQRLGATAYIGLGASKQAVAKLRAMIASLAFPATRRGTVAGNLDFDLGSPARFPTRSFTLVHDPLVGLVYVVHAPGRQAHSINPSCVQGVCTAPGSYYGIAPNTILVHSGSDCRLLLASSSDEFYCPGGTARWNRLGYPIGANPYPPLEFVFAKTSWDGQLVLDGLGGSPGRTGAATARTAAHLLWPGWAYVGT